MREQFEAWMTSEQWFHEDDFKWDESRNCYAEYGIHIAFKAYQAATASMQAERDQLAAECAALKAGVTYFAYSPEYGFDYFKDKQSAIDTAQDEIDAYREDAEDGWSEDVQRVSWGIVLQQAQWYDAQGLHTSDSQHTYQACDYRLVDVLQTPATDRFLAEQRAQGVDAAIEAAKQEVANEFQRETFEQCLTAAVKYPQSNLAGKVEMAAWLELFAAQLRNEVKL